MYVDSYLRNRGGRRLNLERVNTELTNQTRAQTFRTTLFISLFLPVRVPLTSFLSSRYNNRYRAPLPQITSFCLVPFSTIYTPVSTRIATDITRGMAGHVPREAKIRNCYRDALPFDVEPRKSRPKTGKRETVSSALSISYLATDTLGEISFLLPFSPSFFSCYSLQPSPDPCPPRSR